MPRTKLLQKFKLSVENKEKFVNFLLNYNKINRYFIEKKIFFIVY